MIDKGIPGLVALLAFGFLGFWLHGRHNALGVSPRLPGADKPNTAVKLTTVDLRGTFAKGDGAPADAPGSWPCFRNTRRDGIATETVALAREFGPQGPKRLWSLELGHGYAGAAVHKGRVFLLDYDMAAQADALRCLSLADGREIWRRSYRVQVKFNHGMSRSVPAVTDRFVVSMGPKAHVLCVDTETGDFRWGIDLAREYGASVPQWWSSQCPIIEDDRAILAPAGKEVLMMAVDCTTGQVLWRAPNPHGWRLTYVSVVPMTCHGRKMYIYVANNLTTGEGGVVGVSAADGRILFECTDWNPKVPAATPVPVGEDRLLLAAGYGAGAMMIQLVPQGEGFRAVPLYAKEAGEFGSEQHTPVFREGYIYGVIPNGQMVCMDPDGKRVWASGAHNRFGSGPWLAAGGVLYVVNDRGVLTLLEATPAGYKQLAQHKVMETRDAWGPLALAGGRLLMRDLYRMVCLDVSEPGNSKP